MIRFNVTTAFDGECLFDQTPAGLAATEVTMRTRFRERYGGICGVLATGGRSVLDGSVLLDGSVRLNTSLIKEEL